MLSGCVVNKGFSKKITRKLFTEDTWLRTIYVIIERDSLYFTQKIKDNKYLKNNKDSLIQFSLPIKYNKNVYIDTIIITKKYLMREIFTDSVKNILYKLNPQKTYRLNSKYKIKVWEYEYGDIPIFDTIYIVNTNNFDKFDKKEELGKRLMIISTSDNHVKMLKKIKKIDKKIKSPCLVN